MAVYRRNDTKSKRWFYKFEIDGVTYKSAIPTARTRRQAEEAERQARDDVHAGRYKGRQRSMTFAKFLDEHYLPWAKLHRRDYEGRLAAVGALRPYFDHLPLDRISQITVERFKLEHSKSHTRQDRQFKPATVNQRLQILSAILSRAVALKFIRDNPCSGVERLPVDAAAVQTLSYEEEERLTAKLLEGPSWVHDAARVALGTGFRISEVLGLTRDSVDFRRGLLFVSNPKWKNDPRRTLGVPMSAEVREILLRLDRESPSRDLFVHHRTGRRPSRGSFYGRLQSACESVGIFGIHPHSLRHTFGTRLGEADVNVKKIQRLMGHADIKMTLRYVHPGDEGLRAAVELAAGKSPRLVPGEAAAGRSGQPKPLRAVG
ncbi:MAG TPA: site-specific integrase [Pyrinomonadaceae bacterium]|jgi:integrase